MLALAEGDRTVEHLVSFRGKIGVKVSLARRVRAKAGHLRDSHVRAPPMPSAII
jgi:hypothetical protein